MAPHVITWWLKSDDFDPGPHINKPQCNLLDLCKIGSCWLNHFRWLRQYRVVVEKRAYCSPADFIWHTCQKDWVGEIILPLDTTCLSTLPLCIYIWSWYDVLVPMYTYICVYLMWLTFMQDALLTVLGCLIVLYFIWHQIWGHAEHHVFYIVGLSAAPSAAGKSFSPFFLLSYFSVMRLLVVSLYRVNSHSSVCTKGMSYCLLSVCQRITFPPYIIVSFILFLKMYITFTLVLGQ